MKRFIVVVLAVLTIFILSGCIRRFGPTYAPAPPPDEDSDDMIVSKRQIRERVPRSAAPVIKPVE